VWNWGSGDPARTDRRVRLFASNPGSVAWTAAGLGPSTAPDPPRLLQSPPHSWPRRGCSVHNHRMLTALTLALLVGLQAEGSPEAQEVDEEGRPELQTSTVPS